MLPHPHDANKCTSSSNTCSSIATSLANRIAAERQKLQEEDNKRHQDYRRVASVSCQHRFSSSYDVSPPDYGLILPPTPEPHGEASTTPPSSYDSVLTQKLSDSARIVQVASTASQRRRNSASNANEKHFLVDHDDNSDDDELPASNESSTSTSLTLTPPKHAQFASAASQRRQTSASLPHSRHFLVEHDDSDNDESNSPKLTPTKRRPHPNSLLSTAWNMASSQSIHDEMERIRSLMADMDVSSPSHQKRQPQRGSATAASVSPPTKLTNRKTQ